MADHEHEYTARLVWTGDTGDGTANYRSYERSYRVRVEGGHRLILVVDDVDTGRSVAEAWTRERAHAGT